MLKYAIRKTLMTLPLLVGVVTLIFVMLEIAPGSVVDRFISQDTTPEVEEALRRHGSLVPEDEVCCQEDGSFSGACAHAGGGGFG